MLTAVALWVWVNGGGAGALFGSADRVLPHSSASPGVGGWGVGTRISSWEKRKFTEGKIESGCCWYTIFWTFKFRTPSLFKENSGYGYKHNHHDPDSVSCD